MSSKLKELFRKYGIEISQPGGKSLLTALQSIVENPQPWDDVTLSM